MLYTDSTRHQIVSRQEIKLSFSLSTTERSCVYIYANTQADYAWFHVTSSKMVTMENANAVMLMSVMSMFIASPSENII